MIGLHIELEDSRLYVIHVELIDDLIVVGIVRWTYVDDLPVQYSRQMVECLEGDLEGEGGEDWGWIVEDDDVVDMDLCHYPALIKLL